MKLTTFVLSVVALTAAALPALAGTPTPLPLAGALGPVGIVGAVVVYGGYRAVKYLRKRN